MSSERRNEAVLERCDDFLARLSTLCEAYGVEWVLTEHGEVTLWHPDACFDEDGSFWYTDKRPEV
jgi:hypothetical protein